MLYSLLSDPSLLPYPKFIGLVVPIPELPWQNLDPTPLAVGEQGGVLIQYPEAAPQVLVFEVVIQAILDQRGPQAAGKGVGSLRFILPKTDAKDLRNVFRLTDRQPVPVDFQLRSMHTPSVYLHRYRGKF